MRGPPWFLRTLQVSSSQTSCDFIANMYERARAFYVSLSATGKMCYYCSFGHDVRPLAPSSRFVLVLPSPFKRSLSTVAASVSSSLLRLSCEINVGGATASSSSY